LEFNPNQPGWTSGLTPVKVAACGLGGFIGTLGICTHAVIEKKTPFGIINGRFLSLVVNNM
jgi:hypothetical protein